MCAGGALFMLPGLLLLGDPSLTSGLLQGAFVLCLAGFAVKMGLVPLHSWLPDAHPAAPSSVSGPLSGIITKMGVFGIVVVLLMLLSLTLVKSATGRFRIDQAFRFYITVPTALALCSLILVWVM